MAKILLEDIKIYAYHGHLPEENKIGSLYTIHLEVEAGIEKAGETDALEDTVNYAVLSAVVHEEMKVMSKLLEHVAQRISHRVLQEFPKVKKIRLKLSKHAPPMPGDIEKATVVWEVEKDKINLK